MEDSGVDLDLLDELLSGPDLDCSDELLQTNTSSTPLSTFSNFDDRVAVLRPSSTGFGYEPDMIWQIQTKDPVPTVEQRLNHALRYIMESHRDSHILVQIWIPVMRGDKQILTTHGQPFSLDLACQSLANYRTASTRYQFMADEGSHQAVGLPGRVFLEKLPEWSPDVRFFSSYEYPRLRDAQQFDVRGTIALPIFEKENRSCLGVVELVMTTQKVNYSSDIEKICNALQAVDLRTSEVFGVPRLTMAGDSYRAALPEIQTVLKTACERHRLPLAQTWISCLQQGKTGNRHSDETFMDCISTVDDACYVQDPTMAEFQQACSEHHLLRGQGVVGRAFTTNQPCFASNITDFSKIEYPLSHHAKLFHLRAAVAIRLRCIYTGKIDFVLEFFLPAGCIESEERKLLMLTIQQVCRTLRVVTNRELEDASSLFRNKEKNVPAALLSETMMKSREGLSKNLFPASMQGQYMKMERERFSVSTQLCDDSHNDYTISFSTESSALNTKKLTDKKRTKIEKTVTLQELQKYFAGSLKDAAKSLGVCPTTLKRICRQHGINRWPSRKIKKVGHSLKKLQVVIDSVHGSGGGGGGGGIQFSSLYEKFIKTTWSENNTFSFFKPHDQPESSNLNPVIEGRFASRTSGSNSLCSSSCSQNSNSSQGCSSEQKQQCDRADELVAAVEEAQTHEELLHLPTQGPQIQELQMDHCSLLPMHQHDFFKVKAVCGEERVIFRLHPAWGFQDLKQEIHRRFGIADSISVDIKYLDDDFEWILMTCDDDLKECIDVYKLSNAHTIKLFILHVAQLPTTRSSW
ncbi:protein NLP1-like [Zingiber officinale]|uniref:Uncharacterized protein n=1 Tax=Zingiber officinale TaxID=94328 RepID=A0A8J5HDJ7_ZINOF|nr:protein NLP1-like [Zingiber officinale]KAG6515694.1 hypothetical protein ZIOFF_026123 [Zingiber officinale]